MILNVQIFVKFYLENFLSLLKNQYDFKCTNICKILFGEFSKII